MQSAAKGPVVPGPPHETSWLVHKDPADGSGDLILPLPEEALAALSVRLGDALEIKCANGRLILKLPLSGSSPT